MRTLITLTAICFLFLSPSIASAGGHHKGHKPPPRPIHVTNITNNTTNVTEVTEVTNLTEVNNTIVEGEDRYERFDIGNHVNLEYEINKNMTADLHNSYFYNTEEFRTSVGVTLKFGGKE